MAKATLKQCENALRKNSGVIAWAARDLGIGRSSLFERIQNHPRLQEVIREIEETTKDNAEGGLFEAVQKKEPWAVRFYLQHKGKDRGYGRIAFDDDQLDKLARALAMDPEALAKLAAGEG